MMTAPAIAAAMLPFCASALQASDFYPDALDVRMQKIERQGSEQGWPFAAAAGTLACVQAIGIKVVIFMPDPMLATNEDAAMDEFIEDRFVQVTTNPFQLFADYGKSALFVAGLKIEDKIKQLGPFELLGKKLCDQPKGTNIGPSEL